ncbi:hypothetical protein M0R45_027557 [Rubus argutus]|uniref:Uncharacterized protein n=1 Tax=Rubus argutus TaxID=59490 RepID=A0AAW1X2E2_RUBAR
MANSPSIPSPSLGVSTKLSTIEEAEANGIKAEIYPTIFQKMMAELVGTYILIFMPLWVGHVSGCHLNPAVTIAFAADRKFPCKVPMYALSQLTGATLAILTLKLLLQDNIHEQ